MLAGDGWAPWRAEVLLRIGDRYAERDLDLVQPRGFSPEARWWPFVDAVMMPGLFAKKHEVFGARDASGTRFPVLALWPTSQHDPVRAWRPLAIARGFLEHHVAMLRVGYSARTEAWPDDRSPAITGPAPSEADLLRAASGGTVVMLALRPTPGEVHHAVDTEATRFERLVCGHDGEVRFLLVPED